MRPVKDIEKLVKQFRITPTPHKRAKTLTDALKAQQKSNLKTDTSFNIRHIIIKNRILHLTAAAAVLIAVYWFAVNNKKESIPQEHPKTVVVIKPQKTPAELTSVISLNMAFRDGGMDAVERQFQRAEKKVCSTPKKSLTIDQLLCELGECEEI
ncbi:MAG: hypothetical protein PHF37_04670 [Phycisphaerae bacterium]|nr:hypothetical protein [Phycisphaerae bacterium]